MIKIDACDIVIQDKPQGCAKIGTCDMNGCYKLTVFDWLNDVPKANGEKDFPFVEVRFKNSRKAFFSTNNLTLYVGDTVAVEAASGHDIGVVSVSGEMARLQMQKKKLKENSEKILKVYRKASQQDIDKWQRYRLREEEVKYKSREYVIKHGLKMKISDVEFQGDGSKVTFYYTADGRVDFRSLIKDLAREFSTRIEMRQIGFRQEAARLGGIGSCGRERCCSSWMSDFRSVSTSAAKYQQLSLNPQKLAGQCGKLKCCLNFELDSYVDALLEFPAHNVQLQTEKGNAKWIKSDIFKGHLWYMYTEYKENGNAWHKLTLEQVNEIIALNKEGKKVASIEEYASELAMLEIVPADNFEKVVGQDNINRFDEVKPRRRKKRRKKSNRNKNNQNNNKTQNNQKKNNQNSKSEAGQNTKRHNKKRKPNNRNNKQNKGKQNEK
jgi:cell fate regulator YaaT (PSP1 superfamily)